MPFRIFAAGEVLSAANVNDYLAEQAISTFASTGARGSAIASPSEGQFAYLADTDSLTFYNGSAWVNAGSAIAGTALSSGTATSGQVLAANGSGGVSFSTPTQGLTLINTTSFSAVSSISLPANTFSATYLNYRVVYDLTPSQSTELNARLRTGSTDASGTNYSNQWGRYLTTNVSANAYSADNAGLNVADGNGKHIIETNIYSPFEAAPTRFVSTFYSIAKPGFGHCGISHSLSTSYDSLTLFPATGGTTLTGTVWVYGFKQ